ncbi:MAG: carbon dioxide concentrating mechanism protein [Leptolyngbyaceae cyanobacterium CSU_1_4]|nr:carbon dioxide concentrating mechanism protein [Leptolyngbyaceae cyanobacterium CSU_1_4]
MEAFSFRISAPYPPQNFYRMHLPRSPLISDDHLYISGTVTLDASAAIAPNVMLQADPGCHLIIAAEVSIGSGCVLHAHNGTLEIETGATLGSGVLILGGGKIGANACIGSRATLINSSIEPEYTVPPGAIIGDRSRQETLVEPQSSTDPLSVAAESPASAPTETDGAVSTAKNGKAKQVHGQVYLERMMVMMFPHQQKLDNQKLDNPSSDD